MDNINYSELGLIQGKEIMKGMAFGRSSNEDIPENEKVKILKYNNVRDLVARGNVEDVDFCSIDLRRKYKACDVRKGDIVVPILARKEKGSVLYIEKEPKEHCIYNEGNLIIRINNQEINNRYIALILDNLCQEWFKIPTTGVLPFRITVRHLEKAIIPIPSIDEQNKIANKHIEAVKQLEEVDIKIKQLLRKEAKM